MAHNFSVVINLSNFFSDQRHKARIFVDENVKTIQDFQNKIINLFGVRNFFLINGQNEFLPSCEDVRIIRNDDIIWLMPLKNASDTIEDTGVVNGKLPSTVDLNVKKKHSLSLEDDVAEEPRKKKKKKLKEVCEITVSEDVDYHVVGSNKKKKKKYSQDIEVSEEIPKGSKKEKDIESCKKKNKEPEKCDYSEKYSNDFQVKVGNSLPNNISFKKSTPIPTITDEYIKEKKINIVKIDYITKPNLEALNSNLETSPADPLIQNLTPTEICLTKEPDTEKTADMDYQTTDKIPNSLKVPTTKYFFINTPSLDTKKTKKVDKPKRKNVFMPDDFLSPESSAKMDISTNGFSQNHAPCTNNEVMESETAGSKISQSLFDESVSCSSFSEIQNSSPLSTSWTTVSSTPATYSNYFNLSGIRRLSVGNKSMVKYISGVGEFLDSMRSSQLTSTRECLPTDAANEFVTKRKRRRTRSKKSKTGSNRIANPILPPVEPKPMIVDACPNIHIKFHDDENNDDDWISVGSDKTEPEKMDDTIFKAPLFTPEMEPKADDIIAFKVLKISENFTPEVSSYIIGRVKNYSLESKVINLEITSGIEQFDIPKGKLSLTTEDAAVHSSAFKECLWSDLIEPRLLYP